MELTVAHNICKNNLSGTREESVKQNLNLTGVEINYPYKLKEIDTEDDNMKEFLFALGCYEGEKVTVISILAENYVINVKDARYSINEELAKAILV